MKLLHLDSSILGTGSVTRELGAAIVARWRQATPGLRVDYRDLAAEPIPHLTGAVLSGEDAAGAAEGEAVLAQFLEADVVVIGTPMYNFGIPSALKAWIDRILVAGRTFRYTEQGPEGLAGGKQVVIASARGGVYGDGNPADFQEAYLRQVFGFAGITDVSFVRAEGVAYSPGHRADALAAARRQIAAPLPEAARVPPAAAAA